MLLLIGTAFVQFGVLPLSTAAPEPKLADVREAVVGVGAYPEGGTGVVVAKKGDEFYILTNKHVIDRSKKDRWLWCIHNRKRYTPIYIAEDPRADLALLKAPISGAYVLPIASRPTKVGEFITQYGRQTGPATAKITGETVYRDFPAVINYDCFTVTGDSGGPLVNSSGELVGLHCEAQMYVEGGVMVYKPNSARAVRLEEIRAFVDRELKTP